jgi:hypothetical protein
VGKTNLGMNQETTNLDPNPIKGRIYSVISVEK